MTTTLAGIDDRAGDTETAQRVLAEVIEGAHRDGDVHAELRSRYLLASLHHERGDLTKAREAYHAGHTLAQQIGRPWTPYGFDARLMEALVAYELGDWDAVLELTMVGGQSPPPIPEAMLLGIRAMTVVHRGDPSAETVARRSSARCGRSTGSSASAGPPPRSTGTAARAMSRGRRRPSGGPSRWSGSPGPRRSRPGSG